MPNTGVAGRVVDTAGNGLAGLRAKVYGVDQDYDDVELGQTVTDSVGNFAVQYGTWSHDATARLDLLVRVFDRVGRLLYESAEYRGVRDATLQLDPIALAPNLVRGWVVTGSPFAVSLANRVEILIDNEHAWRQLTLDTLAATVEIDLMVFYLDVGKVFTVFDPAFDPTAAQPGVPIGQRLEQVVLDKNRGDGTTVRILVRDAELVPYPGDTAGPVVDFFQSAPENSIEVRVHPTPVRFPGHAKLAIIDGRRGHVIASPFLAEYYDGTLHRLADARRGRLSFPKNAIRVPVHDIGLLIEGPVVNDLRATFERMWTHVGPPAEGGTPTGPAANPNAPVQIVRTLPGNVFSDLPNGETAILEAYQRACAEAQDFLYLENQYLTENAIADALISALQPPSQLQVIILLNNDMDLWFYHGWQTGLIQRIHAALHPSGADARLGVFTLWTHDTAVTPSRIIRNYVHSKAAVADDRWATVGSANLDGVSLLRGEYIMPPITRADRVRRAIEVNAVIYSDVDGLPASTIPGELRRRLWAEHLGLPGPNAAQLLNRPAGGWLQLWNDVADAKLASLTANPPLYHPGRILRWTEHRDPVSYLRALGANLAALSVQTKFRPFDFTTGNWL